MEQSAGEGDLRNDVTMRCLVATGISAQTAPLCGCTGGAMVHGISFTFKPITS